MKSSGLTFALLIFLLPSLAMGASQKYRLLESGAGSWETQSSGVTFSLSQIMPLQLKAFYLNRGFSLEQIDPYVQSCVYMTVFRNDAAEGTVHFIRQNWLVRVDGQAHALVPVSEWMDGFKSAGIKNTALVAFRWAQFPPEQSYEPGGDWNQGMLSMGLEPGSEFDVTARWDIDGREFEATLEDVHCDQ
ncbi:MAG: hypothetical protein HKN34_04460 [Gammaproteobacteria bacterium]|nr:hypothetical protein [Gammaproteobacteria bacterium]